MIKVENGQDPYGVIGHYIRDHVSAIEDMIAVIEIDGKISNELFMVDMQEDGYFVWKSDWWEGEKNVSLVDFFPVSDARKPSVQPKRKTGKWINRYCYGYDSNVWLEQICSECGVVFEDKQNNYNFCPNCGADMRTAKQIIHDAIDNTPMAEDVYVGIKEKLHKAVDAVDELSSEGEE